LLFKAVLISVLTKFFGFEFGVGIRTGVILAQAGEFGFVILSLATMSGLISGEALQIVLAVALISMVIAPFIIQLNGRIARALVKNYTRNSYQVVDDIASATKDLSDHVILCGYGRSGQYLGRFLKEENIPFIALDSDATRVQEASAAGEHVVFGDAGRRAVLRAAGANRAKALIVSYADTRASMKVLHVVQEKYPDLPVIVRTFDDTDMDMLREAGASEVVPEVLEGSLMLASHALVLLGTPLNRVVKRIRAFREERYKMFQGYFRGVSDASAETDINRQQRLHSIDIVQNAFAIGKSLSEIQFKDLDVEVRLIRRPNWPEPMEPDMEMILTDGDVLVLFGDNKALAAAESYLIAGH